MIEEAVHVHPDLKSLLGDPELTWAQRRTRLQGWTGSDAVYADRVPGAQRVAAGACAVGAFAGAATGSALVLVVFAASAVVGAFAPNHPFEALYNRIAARRGREQLPPNRAAKRLGCVIGAAFLGGSALAFLAGVSALGIVLALTLGLVAAFVASTAICVPSLLFTALWGPERGAARSLPAAASMPRRAARAGALPQW